MSALLLWGIFLLIQSHVTTTSSLGFVTHDGNKEVVTGRSPDGATAAAAEQFPLQPQGHHKVRSGYVASVRSPGDRVSRIRMDGGSEGLAPHPGDLENPTAPPKNPSDVAATVTKNKNKSDFTTRRRISVGKLLT